jgi:hypothetical protein
MKLLSKSFLMSVMVLFFLSCDDLPTDTEPDKASTRPEFNSAYSVMWAINTKTTMNTGGIDLGLGDIEVDFGTAYASFVDAGKNVAVGTVKAGDTELKMEANKIYLSPFSLTSPTGITFEGNVTWTVEGGNGFSAINYTSSKAFPKATGLSADETVDRSTSYTVSVSSVSAADSIFYGVNDVYKTVAGNVKSVTFTPEELSKLSKGSAFVQVAPYNFEMKENGTKDIIYGNQIVISKLVTIK